MSWTSSARSQEADSADRLFKAGKWQQAREAYEASLSDRKGNDFARALRQIGYNVADTTPSRESDPLFPASAVPRRCRRRTHIRSLATARILAAIAEQRRGRPFCIAVEKPIGRLFRQRSPVLMRPRLYCGSWEPIRILLGISLHGLANYAWQRSNKGRVCGVTSNDGLHHSAALQMTPTEERVLRFFRQFLMTPGEMLCFNTQQIQSYRVGIDKLIEHDLLKKAGFKGGYCLTDAGFKAMKLLGSSAKEEPSALESPPSESAAKAARRHK